MVAGVSGGSPVIGRRGHLELEFALPTLTVQIELWWSSYLSNGWVRCAVGFIVAGGAVLVSHSACA